MSRVSASAPGKIVLSGEYAVLHGAPAVAAAVNRRARVVVETVAEPGVVVHAPGYSKEPVRFRLLPGAALSRESAAANGADLALFEHLWNACRPSPAKGLAITLDTSRFFDPPSGRKLGLGSSAALSVALVAALQPGSDALAVAELAGRAHREYQEGGSGIDIACATYGGLIDFRQDCGTPAKVAMPQGLHLAVLWSGTAASTASKLRSLEASLQQPQRHATLRSLVQQAALLAAAWRTGDSRQVFEQFADYITALRAFDDDQQLGVFACGHAELTAAATAAGLLYKPCGAGGGDIGVAIALDEGTLERFAARAETCGFARLDVTAGASGFVRDREQHGS